MPFVKQIPKSQHKINNIGGFFRNYRINDGLSLAYVADSIRMNKGFLSDLENGKRNFPNGTIQQLSNFYDISFDENQQLYDEACDILSEAFKALFFANQTEESDILKKAVENGEREIFSPRLSRTSLLLGHYHDGVARAGLAGPARCTRCTGVARASGIAGCAGRASRSGVAGCAD